MSKICERCDEKYTPDAEFDLVGFDDDLCEKLFSLSVEGNICPDCLFEEIFIEQTSRDDYR